MARTAKERKGFEYEFKLLMTELLIQTQPLCVWTQLLDIRGNSGL